MTVMHCIGAKNKAAPDVLTFNNLILLAFMEWLWICLFVAVFDPSSHE